MPLVQVNPPVFALTLTGGSDIFLQRYLENRLRSGIWFQGLLSFLRKGARVAMLAVILLAAYLLGSIPFGLIVGHIWARIDIRRTAAAISE